jgi:2-polyprenyl-3-methyl-5-hydroxy-6-metoxy-1,4-benzoquinol methylase
MLSQLARAVIPVSVRQTRAYKTTAAALHPSSLKYNIVRRVHCNFRRFYELGLHLVRSDNNSIYDEQFYDENEETASRAAAVMSRSIVDWLHPTTVIDVGCGTGALLHAFRNLGCSVRGLEYADVGLARCQARGLLVDKFNIEKDILDVGTFDVVISFEVAEHLPPWAVRR